MTEIIDQYIHLFKKGIEELVNFVQIPNNVFETEQIQQNARFLKTLMEKRGIKVEMLETPSKRPLIYGELITPGASRTILLYGHYDGVPVENECWHSDPYNPVVRDFLPSEDNPQWDYRPFSNNEDFKNDSTKRIFGRSVADSKNAIVATLISLDILNEQGLPPKVNIKFLFDGEEEVESPSLLECFHKYRDKISADLVIEASGESHQSGLPTVLLGVRGILQFDLTVFTGLMDMHSGHFGNFLPNAAFELSTLIATMKNSDGFVSIKNFYDEVIPLSQSEIEIVKKVPKIDEEIQNRFGIARQEISEMSLQELIHIPTLNVRGMSGGYIGNSARNVIPSEATAEIDIRLVKGMDPDVTYRTILSHIKENGWTIIENPPTLYDLRRNQKLILVKKKSGFPATRTKLESPQARYVINSVKKVFGDEMVVIPSDGGSLPLYLFETCNMPMIGLPTSNYDCNQHTHDENLRVDYFYRAIKTFTSLFSEEF